MKKAFFSAASAVGALGALVLAAGMPTAANAVSTVAVIDQPCQLVQDGAGCSFTGNITLSSLEDTDSAYNLQTTPNPDFVPNPTIDLSGASLKGFEAGDGATQSGTVDAGFLVEYFAVKAGNGFVLYWITPSTSFDWNTGDLDNKGYSHLVWMGEPGGAIPEPATWAMMIMGFGGVGALMRRRRVLAAV